MNCKSKSIRSAPRSIKTTSKSVFKKIEAGLQIKNKILKFNSVLEKEQNENLELLAKEICDYDMVITHDNLREYYHPVRSYVANNDNTGFFEFVRMEAFLLVSQLSSEDSEDPTY